MIAQGCPGCPTKRYVHEGSYHNPKKPFVSCKDAWLGLTGFALNIPQTCRQGHSFPIRHLEEVGSGDVTLRRGHFGTQQQHPKVGGTWNCSHTPKSSLYYHSALRLPLAGEGRDWAGYSYRYTV